MPAEKSLKVSETKTRELLEGTADISDSQKGSLISPPGQSVILSLFGPLNVPGSLGPSTGHLSNGVYVCLEFHKQHVPRLRTLEALSAS